MIDVTIDGRLATADTPEEAVYAARHIGGEMVKHRGIWGYDPEIRFSVDGQTVRTTTLRELNRTT
jgi:hypothetical protein